MCNAIKSMCLIFQSKMRNKPFFHQDDGEEAGAVASPKTLSSAYPCRHSSGRGSGGSARPVHLCVQVNGTGERSYSAGTEGGTGGRTEVRTPVCAGEQNRGRIL